MTLCVDCTDDPVYLRLVAIAEVMESEEVAEDLSLWEDSPFLWLKILDHKTRGHRGEVLLRRFLSFAGFHVEGRNSSLHDMIVNGARVEVKTSCLSAPDGKPKFMVHNVKKEGYDVLAPIFVFPHSIQVWFIDVSVRVRAIELDRPQKYDEAGGHGFNVYDDCDLPWWLEGRGGAPADALAIAKETFGDGPGQSAFMADEDVAFSDEASLPEAPDVRMPIIEGVRSVGRHQGHAPAGRALGVRPQDLERPHEDRCDPAPRSEGGRCYPHPRHVQEVLPIGGVGRDDDLREPHGGSHVAAKRVRRS